MSETTEWTSSFDACPQVRTRSFVIDGTNDPKRPVKHWCKDEVLKTRGGFKVYGFFDGATAEDMPR